jgi:hypothetical protein
MLSPFMTNALTFIGIVIFVFGMYKVVGFMRDSRRYPEFRSRTCKYNGIVRFVLICAGAASVNSEWVLRLLSQ